LGIFSLNLTTDKKIIDQFKFSSGSVFPLGVKRPGREADQSPLSSAEVKNGKAIPPLHIHLHGMVLNEAEGLYRTNVTTSLHEVKTRCCGISLNIYRREQCFGGKLLRKMKYKFYARYISSVRLTILFDNQTKQILYLQTLTDFRIEQSTMAS
jgi:hypothetical protein